MRYYYIVLILTLLFNDFSHSQESPQFGKIFKKSENQPPVADAGPDTFVNELELFQFDGSNSVDPNGTIVSYS